MKNSMIKQLSNYETRSEAISQIIESANKKLVPELINILKKKESRENLRWAAMQILATWKEEKAINLLLDIMENERNLSSESRRALEQIIGEDYGLEVNSWKEKLGKVAPKQKEEKSSQKNKQVDFIKKALGASMNDITTDDGEYFTINILLPNDKHQHLIVDFNRKNERNETAIMLYTECGNKNLSKNPAEIIKRHQENSIYGKPYEKESDNEIILAKKYYVTKKKITEEIFKMACVGIAKEADKLEFDLTGKDEI
ncbi:MAG: HEAT repeat domain-containing protein [Verrucomicrobiota bacterium]|nr:HEAT repeat domain-containing protein [Verrucomicrobiota bacterium]